jgi:hypothetical protein
LSSSESPEYSENPKLIVFSNKSVYFDELGRTEVFMEGPSTPGAQERHQRLRAKLEDGFLKDCIHEVRTSAKLPSLSPEWKSIIESLVSKIDASAGRALVGLVVLQLTIKAITPEQNIRLHKSGKSRGDFNFSWREGVSMRTLDKSYITKTLREEGLLSVNKDGVMMTRSLAENYPYSPLYKAKLKGPVKEWRKIVEGIESGSLDPTSALYCLLQCLIAASDDFKALQLLVLRSAREYAERTESIVETVDFLLDHMASSTNAARLLEVAVHALMEVLEDRSQLQGKLRPLAQMRSANKKAGSVGDVEVVSFDNSDYIVEAWDAKYGLSYLYSELGELREKIQSREDVELVGFILSGEPDFRDDVRNLITEIEEMELVKIHIFTLLEWAQSKTKNASEEVEIAQSWILAYAECLCLERFDRAPIDEPTQVWLQDLQKILAGAGA